MEERMEEQEWLKHTEKAQWMKQSRRIDKLYSAILNGSVVLDDIQQVGKTDTNTCILYEVVDTPEHSFF